MFPCYVKCVIESKPTQEILLKPRDWEKHVPSVFRVGLLFYIEQESILESKSTSFLLEISNRKKNV